MEKSNDELISLYDELPLWSAPFGCKLLEAIPMKKNIKVLDIGFGTGFPLIELAKRFGSFATVYGIDPSEEAVEAVVTKINHFELKNVRVFSGNAQNMPFRDGYFDLIVSNNGLNNVNDMQAAFVESARISKPGSPLIFTVNMPGTMTEFYDIYSSVLVSYGLKDENKMLNLHMLEKRKPVEDLTNMLQTAGYVIQKIDDDRFHMNFIDGTTFLNHHFIRKAFYNSWKKIVQSRDVRRVFIELEKKLNSYAEAEGSLRLTIPFACFSCIKI